MPTPEVIAAIRREPRFKEAVAIVAANSIEFYRRRWLSDRVLHDRARYGMATLIMLLHFGYRPEVPNSGLTVARLSEICVNNGLCSRGRVEGMVLMMRATGFLERAVTRDGKENRYVPTAKLIQLHRERHRQVLSALDILRGNTNYVAGICGDDAEVRYRRFIVAMGNAFFAGYRVVDAAPELKKIIDRSAGLPLMICILLASPEYEVLVSESLRPIGVNAQAQRFNVTRTHVRSVLRDAESAGLLIRHGDMAQVTALPNLIGAMEKFFASAFAMGESCVKMALAQDNPPIASASDPAAAPHPPEL